MARYKVDEIRSPKSQPWRCPCCGAQAQRLGSEKPGKEKHAGCCLYAYMHKLPVDRLLSFKERLDLMAKDKL